MESPKVIVFCGPNAVGKSSLSLEVARQYDAEIINADSMQVYRYMDIGTGKVSLEERREVPHHLIDIVDPDQTFSAASFQESATKIILQAQSEGKILLIVGGTGLYIRALLEGVFPGPGGDQKLRATLQEEEKDFGEGHLYEKLKQIDPETARRLHPNDQFRIIRGLEIFYLSGKTWSEHIKQQRREKLFHSLKIGLFLEREVLYRRIEERVDWMISEGLVEEVRGLRERGYGSELPSMQSLGYRHIGNYLSGEDTFQEAVELQKRDTRRYAKRQMTWFRADPEIMWFYPEQETGQIMQDIGDFLSGDGGNG